MSFKCKLDGFAHSWRHKVESFQKRTFVRAISQSGLCTLVAPMNIHGVANWRIKLFSLSLSSFAAKSMIVVYSVSKTQVRLPNFHLNAAERYNILTREPFRFCSLELPAANVRCVVEVAPSTDATFELSAKFN